MTGRLCLLVNSLGVGGAERHMLTLAERIDPRAFTVELVPIKAGGALAAEAARPSFAVWSPQAGDGLDLLAAHRLASHWQAEGTDVVLAANMHASLTAWIATRLMRRRPRLVSAFHSSPDHIRSRVQRVQLRTYRRVLGGFAGLIYVSGLQRAAWEAQGFKPRIPTAHVFNGIRVERYAVPRQPDLRASLGWTGDAFVVGLCASLRPEKCVGDLIDAAALLQDRGVPIRLLIVGDGPERAALERAAAARLAPGRAVFAGFQTDVASHMHACDAMALVSEAEAFSISVLEAMACARPLVLSKVGGAAEQIVDGVDGRLVDPHAPAQIADALEAVWRGDPAAMGRHAQQRVATLFSEDRMLRRYEALLAGRWTDAPDPAVA